MTTTQPEAAPSARSAPAGSPPRHPPPTADDVLAARRRLRGHVARTPVEPARSLGALCGCRLWLKREDRLPTGSFKERGALNALLKLDSHHRSRGVVAPSAGNHAAGLAHHGARLGVPVTLVMPHGAPANKVTRCRRLGADVRLAGSGFAEAAAAAEAIASLEGRTLVHPFDDAAVIAGQGTIAADLVEQLPEVDAVIVPVGGGGLLAGTTLALRRLRPRTLIVGVEPATAPSWSAAAIAGHPVSVQTSRTLADGLAVARVGDLPWQAAGRSVDLVTTVTEDEIAAALLAFFEVHRLPVEGAGATALAALLAGRIPALRSRTVAVLVSGANIDPAAYAATLTHATRAA